MPLRSSKLSLTLFFVLTFLLSWILWFASGVLSRPASIATRDFPWLIAQFGVFAPSLVALLISSLSESRRRGISLIVALAIFLPVSLLGVWIASSAPNGILQLATVPAILAGIAALGIMAFFSPMNRRMADWGVESQEPLKRVGWILFAAVLFPVLFLIAWMLVGASSGDFNVTVLNEGLLKSLASVALIFAFNLLFGGSLGEEIGWRGFALPRLLEKYSPLQASFILGIVWALWHLPIDIRHGLGLPGAGAVIIRLIWTLPLTIIFTWFYLRAKRSLLIALMLHTSINILPDLGFSKYEQAMGVLFLLNAIVASIVAWRLAKDPGNSESGSEKRQ